MALVTILQYLEQPTIGACMGGMSQNPTEVNVATIERTHLGEMGPIFHSNDLVNILTHPMANVLNPLSESTNLCFDVINREMNKMARALDMNDHVEGEDPIIRQMANQSLPPPLM